MSAAISLVLAIGGLVGLLALIVWLEKRQARHDGQAAERNKAAEQYVKIVAAQNAANAKAPHTRAAVRDRLKDGKA